MNPFTIKLLKNEGGTVRFEVAGKISRDSWTDHKEPIANLFGQGIYTQRCLISLSNALHIDSTGVEWLLTTHRAFDQAGGILVLHSTTPTTKQLLKLMRMDLVLNIVDDEASAVKLIAAKEADRAQQQR